MNNVRVRTNEVAISGRVNGVWDKEDGKFVVKKRKTKEGKRYQVFEIAVSSKQKDGTYANGKGLPVILWGDKEVNSGDNVGLLGKLVPSNYTDKEGKEVRGLQLVANCDDMFKPLEWDAKQNTQTEDKKPTVDEW